jgi:hypothetical protein
MIKAVSKREILKVYCDKLSPVDYIGPSIITGFQPFRDNARHVFGMINDFRKTIWIDLTQTAEDILMGFKSNTRNEVRKAICEGYLVEQETNLFFFVEFYNSFAREKGLNEITLNKISKYPNVLIFKCLLNGTVLSMHASILDKENRIVRLLYSASVRLDYRIDKKSVGLSNRLLHYSEFLTFKNLGYNIYDFGGINEDKNNIQQYNITLFKKGFGGIVKEELHLMSFIAWILLKFSSVFHHI